MTTKCDRNMQGVYNGYNAINSYTQYYSIFICTCPCYSHSSDHVF